MDNAAPESDGHGVRAVVGFEFRQSVFYVKFDRLFGDVEFVSDLFITVSRRRQLQNFDFPTSQQIAPEMFGDLVGDFG